MNPENRTESEKSTTDPLAVGLLAAGALVVFIATIEALGSLPFSMPQSWYINRELWIGLGIAALAAGAILQRPQKGDESDTT